MSPITILNRALIDVDVQTLTMSVKETSDQLYLVITKALSNFNRIPASLGFDHPLNRLPHSLHLQSQQSIRQLLIPDIIDLQTRGISKRSGTNQRKRTLDIPRTEFRKPLGNLRLSCCLHHRPLDTSNILQRLQDLFLRQLNRGNIHKPVLSFLGPQYHSHNRFPKLLFIRQGESCDTTIPDQGRVFVEIEAEEAGSETLSSLVNKIVNRWGATYPIEQPRGGNSGPAQSIRLLLLQVVDHIPLLLEQGQDFQHFIVLAAGRELGGDESLHAGADRSVDEFLLLREATYPDGGNDYILATEEGLEAGGRVVGFVDGDARWEGGGGGVTGEDGHGEVGVGDEGIQNDFPDRAGGLGVLAVLVVTGEDIRR